MAYKVCLIGESGCGKTSYVKSLQGYTVSEHDPTHGVEVTTIIHDNITLDLWDCGGNILHRGLGDAYYIQAHACLLFITSATPPETIKAFKKEIKRIEPEIKIILVVNKVDRNLYRPCHYDLTTCYISVKNNYNIDQPLALLKRFLTQNTSLS